MKTFCVKFWRIFFIAAVSLFSSSLEGRAVAQTRGVILPACYNASYMLDVPIVEQRGRQVFLDGKLVGDVAFIELSGNVQVIPGLVDELRARKNAEKLKQQGPSSASISRIENVFVCTFEGDASARIVKSVIVTAKAAGYTEPSFMVNRSANK